MADAKIGQLKVEFTTEFYLRDMAPTISIDDASFDCVRFS